MNRFHSERFARTIALAGAFLLIGASATLGAFYGFTLGTSQHLALGVILAGAALGGELLKPLAVLAGFNAFRSREWMRGLACFALAFVCVVYSLAAELSLAAASRGDVTSVRRSVADTSGHARDSRTRALDELKGLQPARSPAEIDALIAKLRATRGMKSCDGTADTATVRETCGKIAELQAERARSERRTQLEGTIAAAEGLLARQDAIGAADPLATALAAYASALGTRTEADKLAPWLALIPVLFLEVGSALALVATRALGAVRPAGCPAPQQLPDTQAKRRRTPQRNDDDDDGPATPSPAAIAVVDMIKARGGKIEAGQRGIASALGMSKSRVNELLHELAATGQVVLDTAKAGTRVALATNVRRVS